LAAKLRQAYIVGKGDDRFSGLVAKVHGMVFLSTPHKGSGLAETLNNILRSTPRMSSKAYVGELEQGSSSLQDINEQFRTVCQELELVSFYETQKTSIAGTKRLVQQWTLSFLTADLANEVQLVDREAAILGYPKEMSSALNADHHGMSKFSGPADPNYLLVRNMLRMFTAAINPKRELFWFHHRP
jgi:hypothetical protein